MQFSTSFQTSKTLKEATNRGKIASVDLRCEGPLKTQGFTPFLVKTKKMDAGAIINLFVGIPPGCLDYRWWAKGTKSPASPSPLALPLLQHVNQRLCAHHHHLTGSQHADTEKRQWPQSCTRPFSRRKHWLTSSRCVRTPSWTNSGDLWRISPQLLPWKKQPETRWVPHVQ